MTSLLRAAPEDLAGLCQAASDWFVGTGLRVSPEVVEKDFWVTECLRVLAEPRTYSSQAPRAPEAVARAVFKGGTSLSKAFGLIDRFSEDIDVYVVVEPEVGAGRVDGILKSTADLVATSLTLPAEAGDYPRRATKRSYTYAYPAVVPISGALRPGVKLELVRMGQPTPNHSHELRSMLSQFAAATAAASPSEYAELSPFRMDVLAPERTLVDKLCILHRVAEDVRSGYEMRHHARHYYDVHQLLTSPAVLQTIQATPALVEQYAFVAEQDTADGRRPSVPRPSGGFAASAAFSDPAVVDHARAAYDLEMAALAFGPVPTFDEVLRVVREAADTL